jgi:hypothetical protein
MQKKFFAAFIVSFLVAAGTLTAQDADSAPKAEPFGLTIGTEVGFGNVLADKYYFFNGDATKEEFSAVNWKVPYVDYTKTVGKWRVDAGFALNLSTSDKDGGKWAVSKATFKVAYKLNDTVTLSAKTDPYGDDSYGDKSGAKYVINPAAQLTFGALGVGIELPLGQDKDSAAFNSKFVMSIIPTITYKIGAIEILAIPYLQFSWNKPKETNDKGWDKYELNDKVDAFYKVRVQGAYSAGKIYARLRFEIPTGSEDNEGNFDYVGLTVQPYGEFAIWNTLKATLDLKFTKIGADENKIRANGSKVGKVAFAPTIGVKYSF